MKKPRDRRKIAIGAAAAALALSGGAVAANAAGIIGGEDGAEGPDKALAGADLKQASAAALAEVGQGKVTGTEAGDEESAFEVEVTKDDGTQVDVQLDDSFAVVSTKNEGREDASDDRGGEADDESGPEGADDPGNESGPEGADDEADTGPDADPSEPGHQDASDA